MIRLGLQAIPNQTLTARLDGARYDIALKAANGIMAATVVRDGVTILSGSRLVAAFPVIPYAYAEHGNFVLLTDNDELPAWEQFGVTQFLIYASPAELAAL